MDCAAAAHHLSVSRSEPCRAGVKVYFLDFSMIKRFLTVGGFTLASRFTGFFRDIVLAGLLGAGPVADAFFVALRLPNHFRAIFAEGAFNAAFVPAYAQLRMAGGVRPAAIFADRIFTLLLISQVVLLAVALFFTPWVIGLLAPGFVKDSIRFDLAVDLTRVTFPYLLLVAMVTLYGGILNALGRFAAAAAAPILLNLTIIATLMLAVFFPTPGHAAAWGVFVAGCLEVGFVGWDAMRQGVLPKLRWPKFDVDVKRFLKRFAPATVGSAETQIALFADTIIASFLAAGAISALYYADRINQLPIGVIGIAVGTVLLPEMANRLASGDEKGARHGQNRAIEFTLLLSIPFFVAFLLVPGAIMRGMFWRGAFSEENAAAAAATLAAYAIGLMPFVLIRSMAVTFLSRGDTFTPVKALFFAVAVNVALKVLLYEQYAQVGLAFATSIGAWVNVAMLWWFANRKDLITFDQRLRQSVVKLAAAGVVLGLALYTADLALANLLAGLTKLRAEATLAILAIIGLLVYGGAVIALFGREWLAAFRRRKRPPSPLPPPLPPSND
jgi:putative peptidoglycan lipid II flippase